MNRKLLTAMGIGCAVVADVAVVASVGGSQPTVAPAAVTSGSCVADQDEIRGETEVPPERQGVQVFVVIKHGGEWLVDVYQNTRISTSE